MSTDLAARLGWWRQTWRLAAAALLGVPVWLFTGVLLPPWADGRDELLVRHR